MKRRNRHATRQRLRSLALIGLALAVALTALPRPAALARDGETVSDLWIDLSLGEPLVDLYQRTARSDDIARIESPTQLNLFEDVTAGRRLVVFKSVVDVERLIPIIAGQIDIIGYNIEHGPATPREEQDDPVAAIRRLQTIARDYGLLLAVGPDHGFAIEYGAQVAPYVDLFVLQVQRVQTEPITVRDFVVPMVRDLRRANPDLEISVQIRTEGDVVALVDLVDSLKEHLDGVSILTSSETVDVAAALIDELRRRGADGGATVGDGARAVTRVAVPTLARPDAPGRVDVGDSAESPPPENAERITSARTGWFVVAGILAVLAVIAGILGFSSHGGSDF